MNRSLPGGAVSPEDLRWLAAWLEAEIGFAFPLSKGYLVASRLGPLAPALGLVGAAAVLARLRERQEERVRQAVLEAFTTNETSFFREPGAFEALEEHLLPQLMTARQRARRLRIWSAACSTGQEPYSVAMLLHARFPALARWDVEIAASDVDRRAIALAARAEYSEAELARGLGPEQRARYVTAGAHGGRLSPEVTRRVRLQHANLNDPATLPDGPFDLVLLRNVLIYFTEARRRAALRAVCARLAPDGVLLLGGAELGCELPADLHAEHTPRAVWHRRGP